MNSQVALSGSKVRDRVPVLAIVLILLSGSLPAATYYVATNGYDGNPGTPDAPFQTLQRGVNSALPGDTVIVQDGTYTHVNAVTGGDASQMEATPVTFYNSGTAAAPITIKAATKWGAVLDCELICDAYFNLYNASYIVIQDFVITRGYKDGIHSNDAAHHISLRGNLFEFIANRSSLTAYGLPGLYTNPKCHDFIIDGNEFHDIGRTNDSWLDHALYLQGYNFTITNNIFYNILHGWAIQAADGLSNVLIANNTFAFPQGDGRGGQIMLWNNQTNVTIENNIFYNAQNHAVTTYDSTVNSCTIDHNLISGVRSVMGGQNGCTVGVNMIADPNFVNAGTPPYDFHLQSGSQAIDAGVTIGAVTADYSGTSRPQTPDIGAYQYVPIGSVQIVNSSTGAATWAVGDQWTLTITGSIPNAPVTVTVGSWSGVEGATDGSGNFTLSGNAQPGNIGTTTEVWTVGTAPLNPSSLTIVVLQ